MGDKETWAGDRFDIVLMKALKREGKERVWRDVGEDAIRYQPNVLRAPSPRSPWRGLRADVLAVVFSPPS